MPLCVHPRVFTMPAVHIFIVHFVNPSSACVLFARRYIAFPFLAQDINERRTPHVITLNPNSKSRHFHPLVKGHMNEGRAHRYRTVSYTHLRAHETDSYLVCRL